MPQSAIRRTPQRLESQSAQTAAQPPARVNGGNILTKFSRARCRAYSERGSHIEESLFASVSVPGFPSSAGGVKPATIGAGWSSNCDSRGAVADVRSGTTHCQSSVQPCFFAFSWELPPSVRHCAVQNLATNEILESLRKVWPRMAIDPLALTTASCRANRTVRAWRCYLLTLQPKCAAWVLHKIWI